jgi:hypothetical protein
MHEFISLRDWRWAFPILELDTKCFHNDLIVIYENKCGVLIFYYRVILEDAIPKSNHVYPFLDKSWKVTRFNFLSYLL